MELWWNLAGEFIEDSSPLASVSVSADLGRVISPPFMKQVAYEEAHPSVVDHHYGACGS
jgi:hypothetical protein